MNLAEFIFDLSVETFEFIKRDEFFVIDKMEDLLSLDWDCYDKMHRNVSFCMSIEPFGTEYSISLNRVVHGDGAHKTHKNTTYSVIIKDGDIQSTPSVKEYQYTSEDKHKYIIDNHKITTPTFAYVVIDFARNN